MRVNQSWKLSTRQKLKECTRGGGAHHPREAATFFSQCGDYNYFQPGFVFRTMMIGFVYNFSFSLVGALLSNTVAATSFKSVLLHVLLVTLNTSKRYQCKYNR